MLSFFCSKTKWFSCLRLVVLLPLLCFIAFVFLFFHSSQRKRPPKNRTQQNNKKQKCWKKNYFFQLAQMFTNGVPWHLALGFKFRIFAENTIQIVVSAFFLKGKMAPKCQTMLTEKRVIFVFFFLFVFFGKSHSPCRKKTIFEKQKRQQRRELGPSFDSNKGQVLTLRHFFIFLHIINTLFLQNWGFYEVTSCRDGPYFFKRNAV